MAVPQSLTDALNRLDRETTEIGETVKTLRDKISTGMSQEEVTAVQNTLSALGDRLDAIAKDPNEPVPPGPVPTFENSNQ